MFSKLKKLLKVKKKVVKSKPKVKPKKKKVTSKKKSLGKAKKTLKTSKIKKKIKPRKNAALAKEVVVGEVVHYFAKVKAGVVKIKKDGLAIGNSLHIKGSTTDFKQKISSLQIDLVPIKKAKKGQEVGLRVKAKVRSGDIVYKVGA